MLLEIGKFCEKVETEMGTLVRDLQRATGRYGEAERAAWKASLTRVASLLGKPQLESFRGYHLHVGQRGALAVEYRLPASASWCDVVLLGKGEAKPSAVILELKDWETAGDRPGPTESLIERQGRLDLHPSDQVRGYVEYCRRFHSTVLESEAAVNGCVYFTKPVMTGSYTAAPHGALTAAFPVFADLRRDVDTGLPEFLSAHLRKPDFGFASKFEQGTYRQDRDFCIQMAKQIEDPESSPFVLLDGQRRGFDLCLAHVREALRNVGPKSGKLVVVVEGPPGSGKSVIAARLWATLVADGSIPAGNVVLTTTSASQRTNWESLFANAAGSSAGAGVVKPANQYAPETTHWVGQYAKKHPGAKLEAKTWRENVAKARKEPRGLRCRDNAFYVSIVDEAHALMNPELPGTAGPTGWPGAFGPQAWHVIRSSRASVFLMDGEQSFRDRETTTAGDIEAWGKELGATILPRIRLSDTQFRLGGSAEYMEWLEAVLAGRSPDVPVDSWRKSPRAPDARMTFAVVEDPLELEERLRPHIAAGHTARLLATYGRPWKTKAVSSPHALPPDEMDFDLTFRRAGRKHRWSRVWNYAPGNGSPDYTQFVQAPPGSAMAKDPLCEIGCPYVVRGFDYGYVGVLWLSDLLWRKDRWVFDLKHVHESGFTHSRAAVKREKGPDGPASKALLRRLQQAYRILLSRALHGAYVWFEDAETREHVESLLSAPKLALPFRVVRDPDGAAKHKTCVPILPLKIAAGRADETVVGKAVAELAEEWAEVSTTRNLREGMFVAQVRGDSMDREIPDGAWCLFDGPPQGFRNGSIVAVNHGSISDPAYGGCFTVKTYHSEKVHGPEGEFRHERIELRPRSANPDHAPIVLTPEDEGDVWVFGRFLEVLGPVGA